MLDLTIESNLKDFNSFMKRLKTNVSSLKAPLDDFGKYLKKETLNQWKNEQDPFGNKWQPLAPSTLARKTTNQILVETGKMRSSLFIESTGKTFSFGLKDPKYSFHHYGTSKMPARVVIGLNDERLEERNKLILNYIRGAKIRRGSRKKKK